MAIFFADHGKIIAGNGTKKITDNGKIIADNGKIFADNGEKNLLRLAK